MCSSNCANQHAHFPGQAASSIRRALNYDLSLYILSLQTHCKRFKQDCSKICSSFQQQAAATASALAAAAAAAAAATSATADSLISSDASRATKP
jgi:hypothetical protein